MGKFDGRKVWITGASSGIGKATAERMAEEGATLILTALEADLLQKEALVCKEKGAPDVACLPFDLSQLDALPALTEKAWNAFGRIDIFYNNAGISQRSTTIDTDMNVFRKVMDIDFYAAVIIVKTLLPKMIAAGGGQLAVTTSIAGRFGFPLRSAYCSAKHALYGFYETVRAEYYKYHIRVTIVCPGRVQTNISFNALEKDGKPHGQMDKGQAQGVTPQAAAKKIVNALYHNKREVLVGKTELLMAYLKRFFPGLTAIIARNIKSM